jgi:type II secretory pathway pseudopilin PulG
LKLSPPRGGARDAPGFTLVEVLISLTLLILALALAAQLLGETQQMMVDAARQALDPAAALVATRLRVDVLGASAALAAQNFDQSCSFLELTGNPEGPIVYQRVGEQLMRTVLAADGTPMGALVLLRGTTAFSCVTSSLGSAQVVLLDYRYRRSRVRRSPLPLLPAMWGPAQEEVRESLVLAPRGSGLGGGGW